MIEWKVENGKLKIQQRHPLSTYKVRNNPPISKRIILVEKLSTIVVKRKTIVIFAS